MQVSYAITYALNPFERHYLELDSPAGRYNTNAVYLGTTGRIAEVSNSLCELVTKEAEK